MQKRLPVLCHLYGGITPMNVWQMNYRDFKQLARFADAWAKAQNEKG